MIDVLAAIRTRKSIRGYKPDPVPQKILSEIIETAKRAPSAMNTQPWEIAVVTGQVLDNIRQANLELRRAGANPEKKVPNKPYEGEYRQRQVDLAIQLFKLMGIAREDKEKRAAWMERGYRFFDAPAAIILAADSSLDEATAQFDLGAITQTICLTALSYELGTCIEDQGIAFPEAVRRFTAIPASKRIVAGIAIGYPNWDFPANRVESERKALAEFVTWHGFDQA
jgi:nitroreductase